MTGNNKVWRAPLAGLASVAMIATMGVAAATANAASAGDNFTNDNGTFSVVVYSTVDPTKPYKVIDNGSYGHRVNKPADNAASDPYYAVGDGRVLTGYSYDRAGKKPVSFPFALTGDTKLYAQYADAVKVTFEAPGTAVTGNPTLKDVDGTSLPGVAGEIDVPKGTALTADEYEKAVTEKDYGSFDDVVSFVGWTKTKSTSDPNVSDDFYTDEALNADTKLYARYASGQNKAAVQFTRAAASASSTNPHDNVLRYTLAGKAYPAFRAPSSVKQENFKEFQVDGKKYDFTQPVANSDDDPQDADLTITAAAYSADESVTVHYNFNTDVLTGTGKPLNRTADNYTTSADQKVAQPADPAIEKAYFTGWYTDESLKTPFDFSKAIKDQPGYVAGKHEITLYAGWDTSNIARRVYSLHYASWADAQVVQYVDARGKVAVLDGLEDYTKAADGSINSLKLSKWTVNGVGDVALDQVPDEKDHKSIGLDAVWTPAVAVLLNADGGYFSNNSHTKWILADANTKLADFEGYEAPSKDGFTFQGWVDGSGRYFNTLNEVSTDGLVLTARYEATGVLSVEALHDNPAVAYPNKEAAYGAYKENGYTQASWKAYVDTWYNLQDEWFKYIESAWTSHQDQIDAGNKLAAKYQAAQAKLVKASVPVEPDPSDPSNPFTDVLKGHTPHYDDILAGYHAGLIQGWEEPNGTVTFRPRTEVLRQDYAAFLYRLAGSPEYTPSAADNKFTDVDESTPHYKEILWAAKNGYINGYTAADGTSYFAGLATIQRQDAVEMIYRVAGSPKVEGSANAFTDSAKTPFADAIAWAKSTGVTTGYDDGSFGVGRTIIRQDLAAFLNRAAAVLKK